ncbi:bifunctional DNA primase/polymerase [Streptomyces griseoaurantiacus]
MDAMSIHPYPDRSDVAGVTAEGAAWLASADPYPRSTLALWRERPEAPLVLPCGTAFDIVNVPAVFGRGLLDRLWEEGPGSGPVAVHRGRTLLFTAPGTARLLPRLLAEEKALEAVGGRAGKTAGEWRGDGAVPPLLCHGRGDAVTVPALRPAPGAGRPASRWLVAPDTLRPWLPGAEAVRWAAVRAARAGASPTVRISIFPPADQGAKVYDVSRRR